jgi:hypothetical protein
MNKMLLALMVSLCVMGCARKDDVPEKGVAEAEVKYYPTTELTNEQKAKLAQDAEWKLPLHPTLLYKDRNGINSISRFQDAEFNSECYIFEKGDSVAISCVR